MGFVSVHYVTSWQNSFQLSLDGKASPPVEWCVPTELTKNHLAMSGFGPLIFISLLPA